MLNNFTFYSYQFCSQKIERIILVNVNFLYLLSVRDLNAITKYFQSHKFQSRSNPMEQLGGDVVSVEYSLPVKQLDFDMTPRSLNPFR